jgi:hypothetical protein
MPTTKIDNRRDILLLLLYAPGKSGAINEPIIGRTRLVKMLFLFKQEAMKHFRAGSEITDDNFYQFFAWDFGPFSTQVYDDLTFFILRGFVNSTGADEEPLPESAAEWQEWISLSGAGQSGEEIDPYEDEAFNLTEKGVAFTKPMYDSLSNAQRQLLQNFKVRLGAAPLRAILRYVYTTYPAMTAQSKIKEEVLGHGN